LGEVCRPKQQGGLGIRPLCDMNDALSSNGFGDLLRKRTCFSER